MTAPDPLKPAQLAGSKTCTRPRPRFDRDGSELIPLEEADRKLWLAVECGLAMPCPYHDGHHAGAYPGSCDNCGAAFASWAETMAHRCGDAEQRAQQAREDDANAMAETVTEREASQLGTSHARDKAAELRTYWQREKAKLERRMAKWIAKQRRAAKALRKVRARLHYVGQQLEGGDP